MDVVETKVDANKFMELFNPLILEELLKMNNQYFVIYPDGTKEVFSFKPNHLFHDCCCDCSGCPGHRVKDENGVLIGCDDPDLYEFNKPNKDELLSAVFYVILQNVFGNDRSKLDKRSRWLLSFVRENITHTPYVRNRVCDLVKWVTNDYLVMYKELFPDPVLSTKYGQRLELIYKNRHRLLEFLKNLLLEKFDLNLVYIILNY
jgi:hypothetical protein